MNTKKFQWRCFHSQFSKNDSGRYVENERKYSVSLVVSLNNIFTIRKWFSSDISASQFHNSMVLLVPLIDYP